MPGESEKTERAGRADGSEALEPEVAPEDGTNEPGSPEELTELERTVAQRDEYLDALQRLQAEFENFRKRTMRQQTDLLQRASENVLERLLPVLDAFDLAVAHGNGKESNAVGQREALTQIDALLRTTLSSEGLERIDEVGVAFDPEVHHAVAHEEPAAPPEDDASGDESKSAGARVAEVMRAGYRLRGKVLRPALVKVEG